MSLREMVYGTQIKQIVTWRYNIAILICSDLVCVCVGEGSMGADNLLFCMNKNKGNKISLKKQWSNFHRSNHYRYSDNASIYEPSHAT